MKRLAWNGGAAVVGALVVGALALAGCGGGSTPPGMAGGTRLAGTVEAPATQVAGAGGLDIASIARAFALGSRAEAAGPVQRRRVGGATVTVARFDTGQPGAATVTGPDGSFTMTLSGIPAGTLVMVSAKAQGAHAQAILLRALIRVGAGSTTAAVNEATTVGAAAAETVADDGSDDDTTLETASEVTEAQESDEADDASEVPELNDDSAAKEHIREHAHQHLVANLDDKLQAALQQAAQAARIRQSFMAAQAFAREKLGLSPAIHLSRAQVNALVLSKTFTKDAVAQALLDAGIATGDIAAAKTAVDQALDALKIAAPKAILTNNAGDVPAAVALVLAEQVSNAALSIHITTQEQLNAYISALVGATVPGPGAGTQQHQTETETEQHGVRPAPGEVAVA